MVVEDGSVVMISYVVKGDADVVVEEITEPMPYLHGANAIVSGLEAALTGLSAGDAFDVHLSPEEAYGDRSGPGAQEVPKTAFPPDFPMKIGVPFMAQSPDGGQMVLFVEEVKGDVVMVTHLHPLAGQSLHYAGKVHEVRKASEEELAHGHVHGPGGHH